MKKNMKYILLIVVLVVMLIGYFFPIPMSTLISETQRVQFAYTNIGIKDGQPFIDSEVFNEVTEEQVSEIISCLDQYSYRRRWDTLFSDGSMEDGMGEHLLYIYVYENDHLVTSIGVSSADGCLIENKRYVVKNGEKCVKDILEIVGMSID